MAHMHGFRDIGRAKIDDDGTRRLGLFVEKMLTTRGRLQYCCQRLGLDSEIEKPGARQLHALAPLAHLQPVKHIGRELARVQPPLLGQRHQGTRLIIAELWIRTWTNDYAGAVRVRENGGDGSPETLLEKMVQHGRRMDANGLKTTGSGHRSGRIILRRALP